MPRVYSKGLSYFPLSVTYFQDTKVTDLIVDFQDLGEIVFIVHLSFLLGIIDISCVLKNRVPNEILLDGAAQIDLIIGDRQVHILSCGLDHIIGQLLGLDIVPCQEILNEGHAQGHLVNDILILCQLRGVVGHILLDQLFFPPVEGQLGAGGAGVDN